MDIDWKEQWAQFAPHFYHGLSHIPLSNGEELLLKPGEGFGDLSHPTTRLMLSFLSESSLVHPVIDIGCGSGILTLAAILLGASRAHGIDIDENALVHAQKNCELNGLEGKVTFSNCAPQHVMSDHVLILMNMISSEQRVAWASCASLHPLSKTIVTSGILREQRGDYLELTTAWGWTLLEEKQEAEWLSFCFKSNH